MTIRELRLADDLGGKGYVLFGGERGRGRGGGRLRRRPRRRLRAGGGQRGDLAAARRDAGEPRRRPAFGELGRDVEKRGDGSATPRPAAARSGGPPAARRRAGPPAHGEAEGAGAKRVQLARVTGTVVATVKADGLEGVKFLVVQPLDRHQQPQGARSSPPTPCTWPGPGELVYSWRPRGAQALPNTFVPVDHAIVGIVDAVGGAVKIGRVVGTVVSTINAPVFDGRRLLLCDLLDRRAARTGLPDLRGHVGAGARRDGADPRRGQLRPAGARWPGPGSSRGRRRGRPAHRGRRARVREG